MKRAPKRLARPEATDIPPTPETCRKLRRDVVAGLAAAGRLSPEQHRAAEEIRTVWEAVGRGMFPTASRLKSFGRRNRGARPPRDFIDRMGSSEYLAWRGRYVPWSRGESVELLAGAVGTTRLQLTIDVVVDNLGLRQAESRYGIRKHGAAFDHLSAALRRYAERAGWSTAAPARRAAGGARLFPGLAGGVEKTS